MTDIDIRSLRHLYPARRGQPTREALAGVTFSIEKGELFCLLGPNGGGKTTLFRILSTLITPTEGTVMLGGFDLALQPDQVRQSIGVVFQNPSLDKKLTLRENLIHHAHLYGVRGEERDRRIDENAERLGVRDRLNDFVETLSGGLQRRGEIAKALLSRPRILILDEPSTGLDPTARRALRETLQSLKDGGMTVLLTTHLMDEADTCDRLAILNHGHLVALGAPAQLKSHIGGDIISIESPSPESVISTLRTRFQINPRLVDGVVHIEKTDGPSFVPALMESLPGLVSSIRLGKPTLDDVFEKETGRSFSSEDLVAEGAHA